VAEPDQHYQELMAHLRTCATCEFRNEDESSKLCPDLEALLRDDDQDAQRAVRVAAFPEAEMGVGC
jgi:hypothetical protein